MVHTSGVIQQMPIIIMKISLNHHSFITNHRQEFSLYSSDSDATVMYRKLEGNRGNIFQGGANAKKNVIKIHVSRSFYNISKKRYYTCTSR